MTPEELKAHGELVNALFHIATELALLNRKLDAMLKPAALVETILGVQRLLEEQEEREGRNQEPRK
jgi:hypothetical protein